MIELVLGQVKINKNINKKLLTNDKSLESLNVKLETLSSTLKNQSSFNKKVESLLGQIAASAPVSENVKAETTRGGKSTRDPPHPNHAGKAPATQEEEQPTDQEETRERLHRITLRPVSCRSPPVTRRQLWMSNSPVLLR